MGREMQFPQFKHPGGKHRRQRHQERETRRGIAFHAEKQAAGNGRAGPGCPGHQGQGLPTADHDGVTPAELVKLTKRLAALVAASLRPLGECEHDPEYDECTGDHRQRAPVALDVVAQKDTEHANRYRRDHQHPPELAFRRRDATERAARNLHTVLPKIQKHREVRDELDDCQKCCIRSFPATDGRNQLHVGNAADRQEFCQALDDTEHDGLPKSHHW